MGYCLSGMKAAICSAWTSGSGRLQYQHLPAKPDKLAPPRPAMRLPVACAQCEENLCSADRDAGRDLTSGPGHSSDRSSLLCCCCREELECSRAVVRPHPRGMSLRSTGLKERWTPKRCLRRSSQTSLTALQASTAQTRCEVFMKAQHCTPTCRSVLVLAASS